MRSRAGDSQKPADLLACFMRQAPVGIISLALLLIPVADAIDPAVTIGPGTVAYGVTVVTGGGPFTIDLRGTGPAEGQTLTAGGVELDASGRARYMSVAVAHVTTDRWIVQAQGPDPEIALLAGEACFTSCEEGNEAHTACEFLCVEIVRPDAPAGSHSFVLWIAGASVSALSFAGDVLEARVAQGGAWGLGDKDFQHGDPNAQVVTQGVGAKLIRNGELLLHPSAPLYGFWDHADFKIACQSTAGACIWKRDLDNGCGPACTTQIGWNGPEGRGHQGAGVFLGSSPGAYTLMIDRKVDATAPTVHDRTTGTGANLGEDFSYFTGASAPTP